MLALRGDSWSQGSQVGLLLQNAVHSAWRQARQWRGSVQLLRDMQQGGVVPDAVSFAAMVQALKT